MNLGKSRLSRVTKICDLQYGALPFAILLSSNTSSSVRTRSLKGLSYLLHFVIRENEIFISVIPDPLFFLFVNRAEDPTCTTLFKLINKINKNKCLIVFTAFLHSDTFLSICGHLF